MITQKMNPFVQIIEAFKAFTFTDTYYRLRNQSAGSKIFAGLIMSVLVSFLTFIVGGIKFANEDGLAQTIDMIPDFAYSNGVMESQKKYDEQVEDVYVVLDTDINAWTLKGYSAPSIQGTDISDKYNRIVNNCTGVSQMMFMSRTNIALVKSVGGQASYQEMKWSEVLGLFGIDSLSKLVIQSEYKHVIMKIAKWLFIGGIPVHFIGLFFYTLLLSIVGLIVNAVHGTKENFPTIYWITFYMEFVFMITMAIGRLLFTFGTGTLAIAIFIYYIISISKVLRIGALVERELVSATNYGGMTTSGFGVVEDDFDQFVKEVDPVPLTPEPSVKADDDFFAEEKTVEEPIRPQTRRDPFTQEENDEQPTVRRTSGLSLKKDD